jgi:PAS domain S-box-containing protein
MTQNSVDQTPEQSGNDIQSPFDVNPDFFWMTYRLCDFYDHILDRIGLAAFLVDQSGSILLFNRAAEDLTGRTSDESLGIDHRTLFFPYGLDQSEKNLTGMPGGRYTIDAAIARKDRSAVPVRWCVSQVIDDEGSPFGWLWLGHRTPEVPSRGIGQPERHQTLTHDLLNQHQVALGYLEIARGDPGLDDKVRNMLDRADRALRKGSVLVMDLHTMDARENLIADSFRP